MFHASHETHEATEQFRGTTHLYNPLNLKKGYRKISVSTLTEISDYLVYASYFPCLYGLDFFRNGLGSSRAFLPFSFSAIFNCLCSISSFFRNRQFFAIKKAF